VRPGKLWTSSADEPSLVLVMTDSSNCTMSCRLLFE
jgi:hypothetical protein